MQDRLSSSPTFPANGGFGGLEATHFAVIAVLVVLTIIGIVYGMRLARRRREGLREMEAAGHLERTGDAPVAEPASPVEPVPHPVAAGRDGTAAAGGSIDPVAGPAADRDAPVRPAATRETARPVAEAPTPFAERVAPPIATADTATDLTLLKGLGPKVAAMLVDLGVPDIAAMARLEDAQADAIAGQLGVFAPRMARDRWPEQARLLAAGDRAGFEARFGKL